MRWPTALATWLLIVTAESIHGIIRQRVVAPVLGDLPARQVGVVIGAAIILEIACLCIRWIGAESFAGQFKVGVVWVGLIVVFEFGLGTALGHTRERMLSDYEPSAGGFMGSGLLFMLFAPVLAAKVRRVGEHSAHYFVRAADPLRHH